MPPVTIQLFQKGTTKDIKSDSPAILKVFQTNTTACLKSMDGGTDLYYSDGQWWPREPEEMRMYKVSMLLYFLHFVKPYFSVFSLFSSGSRSGYIRPTACRCKASLSCSVPYVLYFFSLSLGGTES